MSNKIKGITLEIGGDTVGLTKALSKVNKETGTIQRELKEVEKALKLDPKNTELLTQKQKLLSDSIDVTQKKVEALKKAKEKADKDMADGTEVNQEQYRKLQREIVRAENALEDAKKQADETSEALNKAGDGGKAGKGLSALKGTLGTVAKGALGFGAAVGSVAVGLSELEESTREYREDLNKLHTAFASAGKSVQSADKIYKDFFGILGESDRAIEAANHLALLTNNEQELAQWTQIAAGINATFTDSLPIEGLTEAANETAKVGKVTGVLADALNWAGINEDDFNEKLEKLNSEQERSALITQTLSDTYSDIGTKYMETNSSVIAAREAQLKWNDEMARFGEAVAPIKADFVELSTTVLGSFVNLIDNTSGLKDESLELSKAIRDNIDAYYEAKEVQEEKVKAAVDEIDYTTRLHDELKNLVDENGNVLDANKNRVSYILNELNEALGIELTLTGDQIQGYKDLGSSIEEMLAKKRAEIILASQEEGYKNALITLEQKQQEQNELRTAIIEKEIALKKALEEEEGKYGLTATVVSDGIKASLVNLKSIYEENAEVVKECNEKKTDYENNYKAIMEGNASAVIAINDSVSESFAVTGEKTKEVLYAQMVSAAAAYAETQQQVDAGVKGITQAMADEAFVQLKQATADYEAIGEAVPDGLSKGIAAKESNATGAAQVLVDAIKKVFTGVAGFFINSPSKWAKGVTEFVDEGLAKGFINKAGVVTDAAGNVVEGVKKVFVAGNEELLEEEKKYLEEKQRIEDEDAAKQKKTAEQIQKEKNKVYLDGLKEAADIAKKERKQVQDYFDDMISDVQKSIANAEKEMTSFRNKLAEIDELAVVPTTTFTGLFGGDDLVVEGTPKLADLSGRIAELTKYNNNLTAMKELGLDDALLEEIKSRGEEEGGLFMEAFLNSTDEERDLFLRQYEEIGKLSGKTAGEMFQAEIEEATKELSDVFAEMNPDMLKVGEDWGTVLGEGITVKIKEALESIKGMVGVTDFTPNAGIVYQTQITQNITSTPQTAYETAEQTRRTMENLDSQAVLS